jgi:hypothetical protein
MKLLVAEVGYSTKMKDLDENGRYKHYHHVYIYEATLWQWFVQKAYHWYDMRIPLKVPGWRGFIELYKKVTGAEMRAFQPANDPDFPPPRWRDRLVGWEYEQDLRCYHLSLMGRKNVKQMRLDITEEQYLKLRDKEAQKFDELQEERREAKENE